MIRRQVLVLRIELLLIFFNRYRHFVGKNIGGAGDWIIYFTLLTFLSATNFNGNICVTLPPVPFELPGDAMVLIIGGFSIFVLE